MDVRRNDAQALDDRRQIADAEDGQVDVELAERQRVGTACRPADPEVPRQQPQREGVETYPLGADRSADQLGRLRQGPAIQAEWQGQRQQAADRQIDGQRDDRPAEPALLPEPAPARTLARAGATATIVTTGPAGRSIRSRCRCWGWSRRARIHDPTVSAYRRHGGGLAVRRSASEDRESPDRGSTTAARHDV